jgi:hypothetical protein
LVRGHRAILANRTDSPRTATQQRPSPESSHVIGNAIFTLGEQKPHIDEWRERGW